MNIIADAKELAPAFAFTSNGLNVNDDKTALFLILGEKYGKFVREDSKTNIETRFVTQSSHEETIIPLNITDFKNVSSVFKPSMGEVVIDVDDSGVTFNVNGYSLYVAQILSTDRNPTVLDVVEVGEVNAHDFLKATEILSGVCSKEGEDVGMTLTKCVATVISGETSTVEMTSTDRYVLGSKTLPLVLRPEFAQSKLFVPIPSSGPSISHKTIKDVESTLTLVVQYDKKGNPLRFGYILPNGFRFLQFLVDSDNNSRDLMMKVLSKVLPNMVHSVILKTDELSSAFSVIGKMSSGDSKGRFLLTKESGSFVISDENQKNRKSLEVHHESDSKGTFITYQGVILKKTISTLDSPYVQVSWDVDGRNTVFRGAQTVDVSTVDMNGCTLAISARK